MKVEINGIPVTVVSQEEAEQVAVMVCVRKGSPTPFTDNEEGVCAACGHAIIFRPHAPTKPAKMCMECVFSTVGGQ